MSPSINVKLAVFGESSFTHFKPSTGSPPPPCRPLGHQIFAFHCRSARSMPIINPAQIAQWQTTTTIRTNNPHKHDVNAAHTLRCSRGIHTDHYIYVQINPITKAALKSIISINYILAIFLRSLFLSLTLSHTFFGDYVPI